MGNDSITYVQLSNYYCIKNEKNFQYCWFYIYIYLEFLYNVLVKNFYTIIKRRSIFFVLSNKNKTAHK